MQQETGKTMHTEKTGNSRYVKHGKAYEYGEHLNNNKVKQPIAIMKTTKSTPKTNRKAHKEASSDVVIPTIENNAAEPVAVSYSPAKLILIEKSVADGKEYTAKKLSDDCKVSYPTVLDLVHNVKKRYGIRTLEAIANTLTLAVGRNVTVQDIQPK